MGSDNVSTECAVITVPYVRNRTVLQISESKIPSSDYKRDELEYVDVQHD